MPCTVTEEECNSESSKDREKMHWFGQTGPHKTTWEANSGQENEEAQAMTMCVKRERKD